MAVNTNRRAVDVAIHFGVLHARLVRSWLRMAVDARERRVVGRVHMAVRTDRAMVRNAEPGVLSWG